MRTYIYLTLLVMVSFACKEHKKQNEQNETNGLKHYTIVSQIKDTRKNLSEIVSKIKITPLKETRDFLIGGMDKVKKADNKFYILDAFQTKSLFCFDNKGNPVSKYNRLGNGPGEYVEILDFDINETKKEIAILCSPSKVYITDLELREIKNTFKLEARYDKFTYQGNDLLLYSTNEKEVYKLNTSDGTISLFYSGNKLVKNYRVSPAPIFYKVKDKLFFHASGADTIHIIKNNECIPYMVLDFEDKEKTYNLYKSKSDYEFTLEERILYGLPRIYSFFYIDDQLIFPYTFRMAININMPDAQDYHNRMNAAFFSSITDVIPYKNNILLGGGRGSDIESYKDIPIEIDKNIPYTEESAILLEYELKTHLYKK